MVRVDTSPGRLTLGAKVSLITGAQYRYEGFVAAINIINNTLTLQNVYFWGTENRTLGSGAIQNADNKVPMVGSIYDSITFWLSSIVKLWLVDNSNDLGDKGVVKAGTALDNRGCRSRQYWSTTSSGDQRRSKRNSPNNGSAVRYNNNIASPNNVLPSQPRMLVSYPRRGRSGRRSAGGYVPFVPVVTGARRMNGGYISSYGGNGGQVQSNGMRILGSHPGYVVNNRYPGWNVGYPGNQSMRRMGHADDRHFAGYNPNGMFLYLPPEFAAAYQPRSVMHPRQGGNRRRNAERRGTPKPSDKVQEIDCTTPYDFETANAELEAELAKISLGGNGILDRGGTISTGAESAGLAPSGTGNATASTGDGLNSHAQPSTAITGSTIAAAGGNGASGDSSIGAVTSTVNNSLTDSTRQAAIGGCDQLGKGEYYIREKCFFDQISRSESGPRGAPGNRSAVNYAALSYTGGANGNSVPATSNSFVASMSSAAAARRERQLNMETFGPMAARTSFGGRRRPPRELLVTAPA